MENEKKQRFSSTKTHLPLLKHVGLQRQYLLNLQLRLNNGLLIVEGNLVNPIINQVMNSSNWDLKATMQGNWVGIN